MSTVLKTYENLTAQKKNRITLEQVSAARGMAARVSQPYVLAESAGMHWEYQNREELRTNLQTVYTKNQNSYATVRDKTNVHQTLLCAGLGMGKSRTLMMVPELLRASTENKTVFTFNVAFENRSPYDSQEVPNMSAVVNRICHYLLGERDFLQWNKTHEAGFTFVELVDHLCRSEEKVLGKEIDVKDVVCLLMIDGVHNLARDELNPLGDDPMRRFLRGELQSLQLDGKYFVFSVCTLTARKSALAALEGSSVKRAFLQIPAVTTVPDDNVSQRLFEFVKGHGRAVEILCAIHKQNPGMPEARLIKVVSEELASMYGSIVVTKDEQTKILKYALRSLPVDEGSDFQDLLRVSWGFRREENTHTSGPRSSGLLPTRERVEACSHSTTLQRCWTAVPSSRSCCGIGVSSLTFTTKQVCGWLTCTKV